MASTCPKCKDVESEMVCFLELPYDSRSDEITLFVNRCPACDHRYLGVYEESRRGALGEDHWNYHQIECSTAAWEELKELISACPARRSYQCDCPAHQKLGLRDKAGYWNGLDRFLASTPSERRSDPSPTEPPAAKPREQPPPRHAPAHRTNDGALQPHDQAVVAVAWAPDGTRIASAGTEGGLCLWDARTGAQAASVPAQNVIQIWWRHELRWFGHGALRVLDEKRLRSRILLRAKGCCAAASSPDASQLALGTRRGELLIFDVQSGARIGIYQLLPPSQSLRAIAWSPDGDWLACAGAEQEPLCGFDLTTGQTIWQRSHGTVHYSGSGDPFGFPDEERPASVNDLAFSPDGSLLISAGEGEHVVLWSPCGDMIRKVPVNGWTSVSAVAVSPDGELLAAVDQRGAVHVARLDAADGEPRVFEIADDLGSVAFSPDGRALAVGGEGRGIYVVDPRTGTSRAIGAQRAS
ncbi:MAG: WD40 repeat domain-containing protein [Deltaproteobacteria bacterium]|jgi:WD40 repeat protein|nr:WD40 repeat domain-containing protein [Deltaproteobacteria bacterium]